MTALARERPELTRLQLIELAQQDVLPAARRRRIASWTSVRANFDPLLAKLRDAAPAASAPPAAAATSTQPEGFAHFDTPEAYAPAEPAQAPSAANLGPLLTPRPASGGATRQVLAPEANSQELPGLAGIVEEAVLRALDSPRVRALLAGLFEQAARSAFASVETRLAQCEAKQLLQHVRAEQSVVAPASGPAGRVPSPPPVPDAAPTEAPAPAPRPAQLAKVLVVGVSDDEARRLQEGAGPGLELRFWQPNRHRSDLRDKAAPCAFAIVLQSVNSPELEGTLRALNVRVVRHTGAAAGLLARIRELHESGLFSL